MKRRSNEVLMAVSLNSSKERTERVEIFWLLDRMDFKRIQGTS
jgi:hypothetical protein